MKRWAINAERNSCSIFLLVLLLTLILSGCIDSNVGYSPYIPYNETQGHYNSFYEPGYNGTEKRVHELASVNADYDIHVYDLLKLRCYPCDLLEQGYLPGNSNYNLEKEVNQSSGSWKFVEIEVTVYNYMNNIELEFMPYELIDTDGLHYSPPSNNDICGKDFCLFGYYNQERNIKSKDPDESWPGSERFGLIYKIPINAIPDKLNYYLFIAPSQPFGQGTLDLRMETKN